MLAGCSARAPTSELMPLILMVRENIPAYKAIVADDPIFLFLLLKCVSILLFCALTHEDDDL